MGPIQENYLQFFRKDVRRQGLQCRDEVGAVQVEAVKKQLIEFVSGHQSASPHLCSNGY